MDFLEPGLLGGLTSFRRRFGRSAKRDALRNAVKPFVLRRTKGVVEKDLPPREEIMLYAEMGISQAEAYATLSASYRERIRALLLTQGISGAGALIFEGLLRLRQAACFSIGPAAKPPSPSTALGPKSDIILFAIFSEARHARRKPIT